MIKSFFLLCKKKIRKKKKKSRAALFFPLVVFWGRSIASLSLSQSSLRDPLLPVVVVVVVVSKARLLRDHRIIIGWNGRVWWWCWGSPPFFDPGESASSSSSSSSKIQNAFPENESKNRIAFWTRIMRKTNAGRPSFVETDKTTTLKKNTKNDDYDILYSSNTLCLNCAFVAANCVVAFDETANMVFGICDDDDDAR